MAMNSYLEDLDVLVRFSYSAVPPPTSINGRGSLISVLGPRMYSHPPAPWGVVRDLLAHALCQKDGTIDPDAIVGSWMGVAVLPHAIRSVRQPLTEQEEKEIEQWLRSLHQAIVRRSLACVTSLPALQGIFGALNHPPGFLGLPLNQPPPPPAAAAATQSAQSSSSLLPPPMINAPMSSYGGQSPAARSPAPVSPHPLSPNPGADGGYANAYASGSGSGLTPNGLVSGHSSTTTSPVLPHGPLPGISSFTTGPQPASRSMNGPLGRQIACLSCSTKKRRCDRTGGVNEPCDACVRHGLVCSLKEDRRRTLTGATAHLYGGGLAASGGSMGEGASTSGAALPPRSPGLPPMSSHAAAAALIQTHNQPVHFNNQGTSADGPGSPSASPPGALGALTSSRPRKRQRQGVACAICARTKRRCERDGPDESCKFCTARGLACGNQGLPTQQQMRQDRQQHQHPHQQAGFHSHPHEHEHEHDDEEYDSGLDMGGITVIRTGEGSGGQREGLSDDEESQGGDAAPEWNDMPSPARRSEHEGQLPTGRSSFERAGIMNASNQGWQGQTEDAFRLPDREEEEGARRLQQSHHHAHHHHHAQGAGVPHPFGGERMQQSAQAEA